MMKTAALLAALAASAAAFAPAPAAPPSATALAAFDGELGSLAPLGFFDPLNLVGDADQDEFDRLREVELKHGRASMLATVGYLTTASGYRFPNFPADVPAGFGAFPALASTDDGKLVLAQMGAFFAVAEIVNRDAVWIAGKPPAEFPGDYRNGALDFGWDKFDAATKLRKRTIELNNGRAAMMGILGLMVHEQLGVSILPGGVLPGQ